MESSENCQHDKSYVLETRRRDVGGVEMLARRRRCAHCGGEWWTVEVPMDWVEVKQ